MLESGGWCLASGRKHRKRTRVSLANGQSYLLPGGHYAADSTVVAALDRLLRPHQSDSAYHSILDVGAGVGQYGHALLALDPHHRYFGFDGAGDIENTTDRFVKFADLTSRLMRAPLADWVFSTEVGEHIPRAKEDGFVRNIHSHACRGVVLSWEVPSGQHGRITGHGHVNCHTPEYILRLMGELGYVHDSNLTADIRGLAPQHTSIRKRESFRHLMLPSGWRSNIFAFRRITPLPCATAADIMR